MPITTAYDVVYPVKMVGRNYELMFSLRSLKNIPHGRVVLSGHIPPWAKNTINLPRHPKSIEDSKEGSRRNLQTACKWEGLTDKFILMNDDFFIMRPLDKIPMLHRGPLEEIIASYRDRGINTSYVDGMEATLKLLKGMGITNPLSYEIHVPMIVDKKNFLRALAISKKINGFGKRTIYGNLYKVGGNKAHDVKITLKNRAWNKQGRYISTDSDSFAIIFQRHFKKIFKEISIYEHHKI